MHIYMHVYMYARVNHTATRAHVAKTPNDRRHCATVARIHSVSRESFDLASQNSSPNEATERGSRGDRECE